MRLNEFDVRLATLQSQIQFATENILELSELPLCKQLRTELESPHSKLCGLTRDCACAALADIDQTLQWILLIKDALERAATVRQSLWMREENKAHELDRLLSGVSVPLPPVATPVLGRSLTGPAEQPQFASISELQARMATGFECAKRTLVALQVAMDTNEKRLARCEKELAALEHAAAELNCRDDEWAATLHSKCGNLLQQLESDPLHVSEALKQDLEPMLNDARRKLRDRSDDRARLSQNVARAEEQLEQLVALQSRAAALRAEFAKRIHAETTAPAPMSSAALADLRQWLAALKQGLPAQWQAVQTGLEKWLIAIQRAQTQEREVVLIYQCPLERFTELRDRFARAQAQANRTRLDQSLSKLFAAAEMALSARPAHLEICAKLVHACEQALPAVNRRAQQSSRQRK